MNKNRVLTAVFATASIVLLCATCAVVSFFYGSYLCAVAHHATSAPAEVAFFYAIPFCIALAVTVPLWLIFRRKSKWGSAEV